ncbi:SRPBCC family protein [Chryseolinea lacunae]|uniref:SRPBCC family protein n=1 Tax=Chryseolinea lacunae TaxID=2801331 RepID=A0ABS1KMB1_9BACT|nr:SRPBCC family protein [Chryseolinea lacunae]MBL0740605.1 SRPBCC family protein [Chryseolinea lacunae]
MNTVKISVQANILADTKKVWDYYTNPKHITKWNFASPDWQCPKAENDLRVGGKYSARMEAKDGSWGFDFEATYSEVTDQKSFTYVLGDGRVATVEFKPQGNGTNVIVTFDAETENSEEMQRGGWQAILDNFKKYAEAN